VCLSGPLLGRDQRWQGCHPLVQRAERRSESLRSDVDKRPGLLSVDPLFADLSSADLCFDDRWRT